MSNSDARHFPYYRSLRGFTKKRRVPIAILRGYKPADELASFEYALRNPKDHLKAASKSRWQHASNWTFPLSAAFWLLVLFRSSAVRSLREHDSPALHKLQQHIDQRDDLKGLRAVATEDMSWEDYQTGKVVPVRTIKALLEQFVHCADVLCTTPALTENVDLYKAFKTELARAVVPTATQPVNASQCQPLLRLSEAAPVCWHVLGRCVRHEAICRAFYFNLEDIITQVMQQWQLVVEGAHKRRDQPFKPGRWRPRPGSAHH